MNDTAPSQQWPNEIVRVADTPSGIRLYFPPLRAWRFALRLALSGIALLVPALIASSAFAPTGKHDAAALLTQVLTAAFVYPLLLFGAAFVLVALFAVSTSLTVDAGAHGIRAVRRVCGIKVRDHALPRAAIAVLEQETATAPRGLGGAAFYRLVALTLPAWNASDDGRRYNVRRMVIADGIPDEALVQALEALISGQLRLGAAMPLSATSSEN
ncbi:MAG: hypothetical protein D4R58_01360 [Betaproteobacteria bacterium]|nr:MAG: hypothetical protein D4R58_01360 [Betaproteobacteria bacterium]